MDTEIGFLHQIELLPEHELPVREVEAQFPEHLHAILSKEVAHLGQCEVALGAKKKMDSIAN